MDCEKIKGHIIKWLIDYLKKSGQKGFVVGVSGGIDSAVVSTLCAMTAQPTICVSMPIHKPVLDRADNHLNWIVDNHSNVKTETIDLTGPFRAYKDCLGEYQTELAMVNLRSRLRMVTLYAISNSKDYLVVGTGNKVEDYGVMFFTLGGDGQVDISPIGDLLKSQVRELAGFLGVNQEIVTAIPTDGLWNDNRGDEEAIGATYEELEWAMNFCGQYGFRTVENFKLIDTLFSLDKRKKEVAKIYLERHEKGMHKINPSLPVCEIPKYFTE